MFDADDYSEAAQQARDEQLAEEGAWASQHDPCYFPRDAQGERVRYEYDGPIDEIFLF